ncbi:DUF4974 domain-containing protein [Mariniphaga sediminis]|uniref:DUF4974 domain-containing protein n=1 Tax=Mariniphaga sediminis TaxID=1628158 RepID=A0A399CT02_9BACT|nr:FecR family protein [Mariniphaga sediminis]RIH63104.1 DUF4974 domain-containing protein [Mariniphaga sediminis]
MVSDSNNNIKELFSKLQSGGLSNNEKDRLRAYVIACYKDEQLDMLMHRHWESLDKSGFTEEPSLDDIKMKLLTLIYEEEKKQMQPEVKRRISWQTYFVRIAAILFIPLLVYTGFLLSRVENRPEEPELVMQEVFANPGSRLHFTLADQTEVWLNSGSSLEYPLDIDKQKQRTVKLKGQGYFKVAHSADHPFFVEVNEMKVKVMGTSFDVYDYADDQQLISTLEEGKIALLNKQGKEIVQLVPGEQAVFDKSSKKLLIKEVDIEQMTSWKDGYLVFQDTPLHEVVRVLGRWFNCTFEVAPSLLKSDIKYTATIQDETIGEVLKMVEISTNVKTNIEKREVRIWAE